MKMTDQEYAKVLESAKTLGTNDGRAAGEWFAQDAFGGRVTRGATESARSILKGIEDGDPEIMDAMPTPRLSGEYADDANGPEMFASILADAGIDADEVEDCFTEVLDAYELAYRDAAQDTIARLAFQQVSK